MFSAFKYRIYPKRQQELRLKRSLQSLCELYNELRMKKIEDYRQNSISLTKTDLRAFALDARRRSLELQTVYSQVVQNVADRVHLAFANFFDGRARFPRNKLHRKYVSLTFPQFGFKINPQRGIYLAGIGYVRAFIHRPVVGTIKRLTIKYETGTPHKFGTPHKAAWHPESPALGWRVVTRRTGASALP